MCANSESSGKTARMHRLALAFADRLCDDYRLFAFYKTGHCAAHQGSAVSAGVLK